MEFVAASEEAANSVALPPPAWRVLLSLAVLKLALHVASTMMVGYGYSADELYCLDCTNRLAWGYVDHPPFSIAVLGAVRAVLGDSLLALRLKEALAGAAAVVLAGLMGRELGGGPAGQGLAGLPVLVSPVVLFTTGYYSMNAIDLTVWTLAAYLLLRLLNGADPGPRGSWRTSARSACRACRRSSRRGAAISVRLPVWLARVD